MKQINEYYSDRIKEVQLKLDYIINNINDAEILESLLNFLKIKDKKYDGIYEDAIDFIIEEKITENKKITKYSDYKINEATIEVEDTEEGVYVLTLHDISNIINTFTDTTINDDAIIEELQDYKFVKIEDSEITKVDEEEPSEIEELDELSSDDENPNFIKKFEVNENFSDITKKIKKIFINNFVDTFTGKKFIERVKRDFEHLSKEEINKKVKELTEEYISKKKDETSKNALYFSVFYTIITHPDFVSGTMVDFGVTYIITNLIFWILDTYRGNVIRNTVKKFEEL